MLRMNICLPQMVVAVLMCLSLAACAASQVEKAPYGAGAEINDPMENMNRAVLSANTAIDDALAEPAIRGYRAVVPRPARMGLRNFLRNLRTPVNAVNQLLQGDIEGFAHDISRAVVNTTIGIAGLIDVAKDVGLDYEPEDFGQTLAVWGVGHGPYLILPILGPSSVRDGTGLLVDAYADPLRMYLDNIDEEEWSYARAGVTVIDKREELQDVLEDLQRHSFDYYAALRSSYYQFRQAQVNDDDQDIMMAPAIPDYDDDDYNE